MGGKSKPTIGYWYRMLLHFGFSRGELDALLEFRGGDRTAWSGVQEGVAAIPIQARELWGGEKAEGGIEGTLHFLPGAADQEPSAVLATHLGAAQPAYRGRASAAYEGLYGALNPYPKPASFKVRRIFKGWDDDAPWYPEAAAILLSGDPPVAPTYVAGNGVGGGVGTGLTEVDLTVNLVDGTPASLLFRMLGLEDYPDATYPRRLVIRRAGAVIWDTGWRGLVADQGALNVLLGGLDRNDLIGPITAGHSAESIVAVPGPWPVTLDVKCLQGTIADARPDLIDLQFTANVPAVPDSRLFAMNPAHMLYDSLVAADMQGESPALIDTASFEAAADLFLAEGFGLCTDHDAVSETVEAFQQRICNIVGASLSQSRVDGKYYLTPIRDDYDLESLPILTDADILEYREEPSDPLQAVNQVIVEWFDPERKESRSTTPIQALGAIQAAGGVISETAQYPEIPYEPLALRVGARDLGQKATPLKRFQLTTTRVAHAWRAGQYFRLQAPRRGIADMVCLLGEIGAGVRRSGSIRLVAVQAVASLPTTVYVVPEPGIDTSPSPVPDPPLAQIAMETPYVELAGDLPRGEAVALAADVGFLLVAGARPANGLNYALFTGAGSDVLEDRGNGDWCPTAVLVESATRSPADVAFTFTDGLDLDRVRVGEAVLWGDEICRVDALDLEAGTLVLGRGCGDTTAQLHAAGERLWFFDQWGKSDEREYVLGEEAHAKLRTRTSSQLLAAELAPTLTVVMDQRAARPYPPAKLRITDDLVTDAVDPSGAYGELLVTWAHRDRLLQADQLVDAAADSIGPEDGVTYTVRYYLDDVIDHTESGITGTAATPHTLSGAGVVRIEVEAERDELTSWQAATAQFSYLPSVPDFRITDAIDNRITDSGDRRITE